MKFQTPLEENHAYFGTGNTFSRSLFAHGFLQSGRDETQNLAEIPKTDGVQTQKSLIFFEDLESIKAFKKIFEWLGFGDIRTISSELDMIESHVAEVGLFAISSKTLHEFRSLMHLLKRKTLHIKSGLSLAEDALSLHLTEVGYSFDESLESEGNFRREWDSIFVRIFGAVHIISFFDGTVEDIKTIRDGKVSSADFLIIPDRNLAENTLAELREPPVFPEIAPNTKLLAIETDFFNARDEFLAWIRTNSHFLVLDSLPKDDSIDAEVEKSTIDDPEGLASILSIPENTLTCYTRRPENLSHFEKHARAKVHFIKGHLALESFSVPNANNGRHFVLADDTLSLIFTKNRITAGTAERIDLMLKMAPGDFVVHRDHGIAKFRGIVTKELPSGKREYLELQYAADEKLFVPLSEVYRVGKYLGEENPKLHKLSGGEWKKSVERAEVDATKVAEELLDIYAKRKIVNRVGFAEHPKEEEEFRNDFPYPHTKDQKTAISEILEDLAGNEPMDRLLSGDVGFGKTEVAMNAAYRVILEGKQVAIVSPLVVLAYDHFDSVKKRMESFGVRIAVLTRLTKTAEAHKTVAALRKGEIDLVIGTHRLLSNDIHFKNLGLLIVDEEHKFGVLDKERIAGIRANLDILSLSATPIPRSLNLSLSGIRAASMITTPPVGKKPIRTEVARWDDELVKRMIEAELSRDGQVLVLHNRVRSIEMLRKQIAALSPKGTRIAVTHGQMHSESLEDTILDFKEWKFDILISTTVIENGVNFLRANTILIDNADEFGLASLHQLRGRVGRKDIQAYCALLYHKEMLEDDAKRRLVAIASNSHLGAGFEIAMRDLEIRGAGEILGVAQSGKTKDTGISLYLKILEEKVADLKGTPILRGSDVRIELDVPYSIPDTYFTSEIDKLHFFRSLESVRNEKELNEARASFLEERDELTEDAENLFLLVRARLMFSPYNIEIVRKSGKHYFFEFKTGVTLEILKKFISSDTRGDFIFVGNGKIRTESEAYENDVDFLRKTIYSLKELG